MSGPLAGVRVLEFAGIGPAPFCAMLLSDLGADVVRIERADAPLPSDPVTSRGRSALALDLKSPAGIVLALAALERADVLVEGFRPGVMERLGLGPEVALERNPRLIYGRMTGWGQSGPLAHAAGHDIAYIALTGALAAIGPAHGPPVPPLNLVGDFGGGALYLALGIAAALYERERSGRGQVIDAAIVDGVASLMAMFGGLRAQGRVSLDRERNFLSGAAPNYRCYACADGRYVAVGPLEPKFFALLLQRLGVELPHGSGDGTPGHENITAQWAAQADALAAVFATKPRDEWAALLEGTDACVAPVLALDEAPAHPHLRAREVYVERDGIVQPAPAPRFSRTPGALQGPAPRPGEGGRDALRRWGVE
ncbi:MAG: alpha-methylacyl-CoA racemase [Candidatus Eremiobacteraeota bacterium]|nr:alpha-methylacyl-CoA racemase [Candidatus Eremiobacteraeota bacterium]